MKIDYFWSLKSDVNQIEKRKQFFVICIKEA